MWGPTGWRERVLGGSEKQFSTASSYASGRRYSPEEGHPHVFSVHQISCYKTGYCREAGIRSSKVGSKRETGPEDKSGLRRI